MEGIIFQREISVILISQSLQISFKIISEYRDIRGFI